MAIELGDTLRVTSVFLLHHQAGLVDSEGHLVGEVDGQGFGIGQAPFSSKPGKKGKSKKAKEQVRLVGSCFLSHLSPAFPPLQDFLPLSSPRLSYIPLCPAVPLKEK